eukprot:5093250-Alexandrium_andersonii.AAC.1
MDHRRNRIAALMVQEPRLPHLQQSDNRRMAARCRLPEMRLWKTTRISEFRTWYGAPSANMATGRTGNSDLCTAGCW